MISSTGAGPGASPGRRVVVAFLGGTGAASGLDLLAGDPGVEALGLLDATLGGYDQQQALLDLTQGARVSGAAYRPTRPPPITVTANGQVGGWAAVRARAGGAGVGIDPGLLGSAVPGGAAYAGSEPLPGPEAVVAADRGGRLAAISLGLPDTLAARAGRLVRRFELVVVGLPDRRQLDQLLRRRGAGELVLVLEAPPPTRRRGPRRSTLLGIGVSGLPGTGGTLATPTTRRPGLVTGLDLAPTVLSWLKAPLPPAIRGQAMIGEGTRDGPGLDRLQARLEVIAGRRWPTIDSFLLGWLGLLLAAGGLRRARGLRLALRLGGLAALWTPCTVLLAGAVAPSRAVEIGVVVGGGFLLALISDLLVAWPRAPLVAGAAMAAAYTVDLGLGSPLTAVSLLGPNPIAGGRFYGIGNELEAALAVVLLAGLAAALPQRAASPRAVASFALGGLFFTAVAASGRLGADVGALFTIGGGTAAGALALRPRPSRRAAALACAVPFIGLLALAALDLATRAGGHYTSAVLHAGSAGDLVDTIAGRAEAAWRQLRRGVMPLNTVVCLAAGAYALRHRARVLSPVAQAAGWHACLVGGLAGGVLGSLTNDSGPVLLVIATFGLACVLAYLHGGPRPARRPTSGRQSDRRAAAGGPAGPARPGES